MVDTPATASDASTVSVGMYLATRLTQLGVRHLFGLPGDMNLNLLDEMLEHPNLAWAGSSNELNAAYTADGYARVGRHLGALVTTFGVGELSALNGVAGSFAEHVPVLQITGAPSQASMAEGAPLHHTLLDGDFTHFMRAFTDVTVAREMLRPETAGEQIDRVLHAMIASSRPGYLAVPLDVAAHRIAAAPLDHHLRPPSSDPAALDSFTSALRGRMSPASRITILAGPGVHRRGLEAEVGRLASHPGVQVASQTGSKAVLDETHPASLGTYMAAITRSSEARQLVDEAPCLILVGTVFSDFTTGFFSQQFKPEEAIELGFAEARIGHAVYPGVRLEQSVAAVHALLTELELSPLPQVTHPRDIAMESAAPGPLSHEEFWAEIQDWLPRDITLAAEAGTAFYGAVDLHLPEGSDLLGQPIWSSIGFTLPAIVGAALSRPERRPILLIGDGSAQLTIGELGHLYRSHPDPVVLLLDNDGYTVERKIQSPDAPYQDIVRWDWSAVPAALGASDIVVNTVTNVTDLSAALKSAAHRGRAHFIHVALHRDDAPRLLLELAAGVSEVNTH